MSGVAAVVVALGLGSASAASAHVHVYPDSTASGGRSVLTFRVPTESADASTSKLVIDLPLDTPLLSVSTKPVPGWDVQVQREQLPEPVDDGGTTVTEAPARIVWTARPGNEVGPGQYQEFVAQVGPLPGAGTELAFPAHQSYTDGTVVDWDEVPAAGEEEPERPAPVLTVTAAQEGSGHDGSGHDAAGDAAADHDSAGDGSGGATAGEGTQPAVDQPGATADADAPVAGSDGTARVLGVVGLALGAAALVVSLLTARRRTAS